MQTGTAISAPPTELGGGFMQQKVLMLSATQMAWHFRKWPIATHKVYLIHAGSEELEYLVPHKWDLTC